MREIDIHILKWIGIIIHLCKRRVYEHSHHFQESIAVLLNLSNLVEFWLHKMKLNHICILKMNKLDNSEVKD